MIWMLGSFVLLCAALISSIQPPKNVPRGAVKPPERYRYEVEYGPTAKGEWYIDKDGCFKMKGVKNPGKKKPGIWKKKDGVCAR